DDVVGLDESPIGIDDPEAIGIPVRGNANLCAGLVQFRPATVKKMVVWFGRMSAEKNIARVMHDGDINPGFSQNRIAVTPAGAPEGVEDNLEPSFFDALQIHDLFQPA